MRRALKSCLAVLGVLILAAALLAGWFVYAFTGIPFNGFTRPTQVPITPAWAFEPWVWEDDVNTAEFVRELLDGYREHDIPAHTLLIDSPWSTRYNDFIVDEARYPDPAAFFGQLEDEGVNVVLWMTCMVNDENDDTAIRADKGWFEDARTAGYLAGDGFATGWWKGHGGFIDYANPEAMAWWRAMQQQTLDWGVDGWKLDGTATFFSSRPFGFVAPIQKTAGGWMTTRTHMDHYYRDEYLHGLTKNPNFVTLSRSIDGPFHPEGFAPLDAAPVTWVGDQDHTWSLEDEGLEEALGYIMKSAKLGYNVIGSDVAGYGGSDIPANLYIRWAQFSAFCGLFLNGGHGERRLWMRSPEELEIVRQYAWLHSELVPYMFSHTVRLHHEGGAPLMQPVGETYNYRFGDAFFVSPIHRDVTEWTVDLPEGEWRYLFNLRESFAGPRTLTREFPLNEFPAFVRAGVIVPMNVRRAYTGFGDSTSEGFLTLLVVPGADGRAASYNTADPELRTDIALTQSADAVEIAIAGAPVTPILRIAADAAPQSITRNGAALTDEQWRYDEAAAQIVIRAAGPETGVTYSVR